MLPRYEEKHTHDAGTGYNVTNEEPEIFASMLGKQRFERAASIASGGEIPLLLLLNRCKEVVAVDHSYRSLVASYTKAVMLESMGLQQMMHLLREEKYDDLYKASKEATVKVPENLLKCAKMSAPTNGVLSMGDFKSIRREWSYISTGLSPTVQKKLGKLLLVHGDLQDLAEYGGPFDLLYVSNAMEHTSRDHKAPSFTGLAPLLKEGGYLLLTCVNQSSAIHVGWQLVQNIRGYRTTWDHRMYQKVTPPAVVIA